MRRRLFVSGLAAVGAAIVAGVPVEERLRAQTAPTSYTFTRIDENLTRSEQGTTRRIGVSGGALNDQGTVAYMYCDFLGVNGDCFIVTNDGRQRADVYQDLTHAINGPTLTDLTGIDGDGTVFMIDHVFGAPPANPCPAVFSGGCLFDTQGSVQIQPAGTLGGVTASGTHPRVVPTVFPVPRVVYFDVFGADTSIGSNLGTIAGPGTEFSRITHGTQPGMNINGEVAFSAVRSNGAFGIYAARIGAPTRTIVESGVGGAPLISHIGETAIDDQGRVAAIVTPVSPFVASIYLFDGVSPFPAPLIDGVNGRLKSPSHLSINGSGKVVFRAFLDSTLGPDGIYTGPDPVADKVIAVGDILDGSTVRDLALPHQSLKQSINNNGLNGAGQIIFFATLADDRRVLYRADPVGADVRNPILPPPGSPFRFPPIVPPCAGACRTFWDPPFAIGYEYLLSPGDPNFESVLLPAFPAHDTYELHLWNGAGFVFDRLLTGGVEHLFTPGGVDRFRVMGIPQSLGLDVNDPQAFVTGLTFVGPGAVNLTMTPIAPVAQHQVTTTISPTVGGTISLPSGLYAHGTTVTVVATPAAGFTFAEFSGDLTGTASSQTLDVIAPLSITANFTPLPTTLRSAFSAKAGPPNARTWSVRLSNVGTGAALNAQVNSLTFTQVAGPACTPVIVTPLPASAGTLLPGALGVANVTIDFSGCASAARFTTVTAFTANAGTVAGTTTLYNQFR